MERTELHSKHSIYKPRQILDIRFSFSSNSSLFFSISPLKYLSSVLWFFFILFCLIFYPLVDTLDMYQLLPIRYTVLTWGNRKHWVREEGREMSFFPIHRLHTHARSCVPKTQVEKTWKMRVRSYISLIWSLRLAYFSVVTKKSLFYLFKINTVCGRSHIRRSFFSSFLFIPSPESLPWLQFIFLLLHQFILSPAPPKLRSLQLFSASSLPIPLTSPLRLTLLLLLYFIHLIFVFFNLICCSVTFSHYWRRAIMIEPDVVCYFSWVHHKSPLPF